jgi:hypothetical protein
MSALRKARTLRDVEAENAELREALAPFARLADVCDHFKKQADETICSWRIEGKRRYGPTVEDCRRARQALGDAIHTISERGKS